MEQNLQQVMEKCRRLAKLLVREGEDRRTGGRFYVVEEQAVILFGSETWVMNSWMDKALEGFHHREVRRMVAWSPNVNRMGHGCNHLLGQR